MTELTTLTGGCHCKAVRFEVDASLDAIIQACNCSICAMTGFLHLIVPARQFRLVGTMDNLTCYQFGTGVAKHYFCSHCGIKSYYVPRSNPGGFSINVRCLDANDDLNFQIEPFDGQNWEEHADQLQHLTSGD